ncbi:MAG TPA: type II toxin-antitoxin system RatA family toxin [Gammaproteobacteria bacterium]|nr:type II toxin-antitoxin system RatA family toxin [Gammaproteobacteria bacterium]
MPSIQRHALVPYPPDYMFKLVDNILLYPEFLPWCASTRELHRSEHCVEASIELAKGAVRKSFTTRNEFRKNDKIEMKLVEGPFKYLQGFWKFDALDDGKACRVSLDLDYEFSNRIVGMAIGPVFGSIANSLVDAFVNRAEAVYG